MSPLLSICEIFKSYYSQKHGILAVTLTSPFPLREDQTQAICDKLKRHYGKEIQPVREISPQLIGGFKVQVGDTVYDYSIRSQLEKFRETALMA